MANRQRCELYVNGRFLVQRQTGVQRFAQQIIRALDAVLDEPAYQGMKGRVVLVTPRGAPPPSGLANLRLIQAGSLGTGYAWEQIDLVGLAARGVLLNLCNLGPLAKRRQVVVLHDASTRAVPEAFSFAFRSAYRVLIPMIIRRAARLVTVSEFSRGEISHWFSVPKSRLVVCHEGGEHILANAADTTVLDRHDLPGRGYFLAVGVGPTNKNHTLLLQAFAQAGLDDVRLVLTGRRSSRVHGAAALEIRSGQNLVYVGHVPDAELRALYEGALGLLYPSTYEGFGLPPLEAMTCGCPVIISDQPALLEVAEDAALVVPRGDVAALTAAICAIADDAALRERLSMRGCQQAAQFTWRAAVLRLLEQCEAAIA